MSTGTMNPWSKKASSGEGDFELPPAGSYPAALVGLIDLGTTPNTYKGETKDRHKVLFVWELTSEVDTKGETFKVAKDFTFSLNEKAKLRAFLEGWLGRKFGDAEEIDISSFMTMNCLLNIIEDVSAAGKKFVEITSATKLPRGVTGGKITVEPFAWSFDGWDVRQAPPIPDWVPMLYGRKVADDIRMAGEWMKLTPF